MVLGLFLLLPVLMALWVSFSDWSGRGSPLSPDVGFVGLDNYPAILTDGGLAGQDFGTSLRNNFYYVLLVVPLQTALALFLALLVHTRMLRGRGFFRTAFYFPSVTSSVAITVLWLFLFSTTGAVNEVLGWSGSTGRSGRGPARGPAPAARWARRRRPARRPGRPRLPRPHLVGLALRPVGGDGRAHPARVLTTSGTFMLMFLAALNDIAEEIDEAGLSTARAPGSGSVT